MELKPELMADLKKPEFPVLECKIKFKIPRKLKEHEQDGLDWGSGYVVNRMKYVQPDLGDYFFNATNEHAKPTFIKKMNRGGLATPTKTFRRDYRLNWQHLWSSRQAILL